MAEAARTAGGRGELRYHFELHLHHRDHYQLRDALPGPDGERLGAAIPARTMS